MKPNEIVREIRKFVDHGISPGQAFDAILTLRQERVTFADIQAACASTITPDTDLGKVATEYTDDTLMPFGKHRGVRLMNVPADYLLWLWDQRPIKDKLLEAYIKRSLPALNKETPAKLSVGKRNDNIDDDNDDDEPNGDYSGNRELD